MPDFIVASAALACAPCEWLNHSALRVGEAREIIKQHGCEVVEYPDHCVVTFPEGTMRMEILPRLSNERYEITLPDGFRMIEMDDRWQEHSLLFLLIEGDPCLIPNCSYVSNNYLPSHISTLFGESDDKSIDIVE